MMKLKTIATALSVATISVGLAACSSFTGKQGAPMDDAMNMQDSAYGGVRTAGLGEGEQFRGDSANGQWMDSTTRQVARQLGLNDNTVYFGFDRSSVSSKYDYILQVNANYLKSHPQAKVRLEGNTDPRGSREYNIGLGQRRSDGVDQRLIALGVSPRQLVTVSYGQERPAVPGDSAAAYAKDRRVNIVYITG